MDRKIAKKCWSEASKFNSQNLGHLIVGSASCLFEMTHPSVLFHNLIFAWCGTVNLTAMPFCSIWCKMWRATWIEEAVLES